MIGEAGLIAELRAMGVNSRQVMVHSSYKAIGEVEGGPQTVVDAFRAAVGFGTLLFPTYDFESWTERGYWDRENSPSKMGVISEMARLDRRFRRTSHPMLSYAVYAGLDTPYGQDYQAAHGSGSLFDHFVQNNGLLISIGADRQAGFRELDTGFTISNHAGVLAGAPWRSMRIFEGVYVFKGQSEIRRYAASVRTDDRYITAVTPAHMEAERLGFIRRFPLGNADCWVAYARPFVEWATEAHISEPDLWRRAR